MPTLIKLHELHPSYLTLYSHIRPPYENNDIEVIADGTGTLMLNEKHLEEKLGHKHLPVITNKYDPVYKKHRYELDRETKKRGKQNIFS